MNNLKKYSNLISDSERELLDGTKIIKITLRDLDSGFLLPNLYAFMDIKINDYDQNINLNNNKSISDNNNNNNLDHSNNI